MAMESGSLWIQLRTDLICQSWKQRSVYGRWAHHAAPHSLVASEVNRLMQADTAFLQMLSEVRWGKDNSLVARWSKPAVDFLLPLGLSAERLREGLIALTHAINQTPRIYPNQST
ncbi:MAG: hypothetical protein CM1200mP14_20210 [Gammaproteobacteria bacterium]|nr:MAG: hypothetical protein CM1200mP14_20210 [Gammaproteobacteria bacterium]